MALCKYCGMDTAGEPNYCGNCGVLLGSFEVEGAEVLTEELEDDWEVGEFQDVEDVARIAVPENYEEFSLHHLRRRRTGNMDEIDRNRPLRYIWCQWNRPGAAP
jgi:hypothetical protein